jgi:hypothetical protein
MITSGQHVAGLIRADRVGGFFQPIAQIILLNAELLRTLEIGERREFGIAEAVHLEMSGTADDGGHVFAIDRHLYFTRWQFAHDVDDFFRGQGRGTLFVHIAQDRSRDADIQIRSGKLQAISLGHDQHIGQNRKRRATADDVLYFLQPFEERFFGDSKLHGS